MTGELPRRAEVVIAGGGFAGAATAWALARLGVTDVLLLEGADQFGSEASGRNAAMARQLSSDPATAALLRQSVATFLDPDGDLAAEARRCGSMLLVEGAAGDAWVAAAAATGGASRVISRDAALARVPVLDGARFDRAIATATDAVVEVSGLLWRYLRMARSRGARLVAGCPVTGIHVAAGRLTGVMTPRGDVACTVFVNATGAWANGVAGMAGLAPLPMAPYRRHLVTTPPLTWVDAGWPFVWHLTDDYYFRPEVGGLLLCACDQDPVAPGPARRDPAILETLADRLSWRCPRLAGVPVQTWWAGLRTISADGRFVIGPDPRLAGFFWVAGLGGHGMTGSAQVGAIAAAWIAGCDAGPVAPALHPGRLLGGIPAVRQEACTAGRSRD